MVFLAAKNVIERSELYNQYLSGVKEDDGGSCLDIFAVHIDIYLNACDVDFIKFSISRNLECIACSDKERVVFFSATPDVSSEEPVKRKAVFGVLLPFL